MRKVNASPVIYATTTAAYWGGVPLCHVSFPLGCLLQTDLTGVIINSIMIPDFGRSAIKKLLKKEVRYGSTVLSK